MPNPLRVVFMGTPEFAVPTLQALASRPDLARIVAVYTQPDRPSGRGQKIAMSAVKRAALDLGLTVLQPENINAPDEKRKLADHLADAVVVVAYAQFLSQAILNTPRLGCINVHSSLLPKYRGAAPIQFAIWKGEKESGVTTMRLVQQMDAGPILLQKSIPISDDMTASELHDQLSRIGADLLVDTLSGLRDGKIAEVQQDDSLATYAKLIRKEDGRIHWTHSGSEILRQIRALVPWPGCYTMSSRGTLRILKARFHEKILGAPLSASPGDVHVHSGALVVRCADGWLEPVELQPEGKKPMSAHDFLNGLRGATLTLFPNGNANEAK